MSFSVCVGNYSAYNNGDLIDEWITLPKSDDELNKFLSKLQAKAQELTGNPSEEFYIADYDGSPFGPEFERNDYIFTEHTSLHDLNLLAKRLECMEWDEIDKLAIWSEVAEFGNSSISDDEPYQSPIEKILQCSLQTDDIPWYSYGKYSDYLEYPTMSNEAKFGYHTLDDLYPEVNEILEDTSVFDIPLIHAFDAEQIGISVEASGYVRLFDGGYINNSQSGPDTRAYDRAELEKEIETEWAKKTGQSYSVNDLIKSYDLELDSEHEYQSGYMPLYSMYEHIEYMLKNDSVPRYIDDEIRDVAGQDVSVYSGDQLTFYENHTDICKKSVAMDYSMSAADYFANNSEDDMEDYHAYCAQGGWQLWAEEQIKMYEEDICEKVAWGFIRAEFDLEDLNATQYVKFSEIIAQYNTFEDLQELRDELVDANEEIQALGDPVKWLNRTIDELGCSLDKSDGVTYELTIDTDRPECEMLIVNTPAGSVEFRGLHIGSAYGTPQIQHCTVFAVNGDDYVELGDLDFQLYGPNSRPNCDGSLPGNQDDYIAAVGEFMLDHMDKYDAAMRCGSAIDNTKNINHDIEER